MALLQEYEVEAQAVEDVGQERELEIKPMEGAENQVVEVSLNSVVGLTSPKTLKLAGEINNQKVVVLIDNDASHNFISNELVSVLKLPITNMEPYGGDFGNWFSHQSSRDLSRRRVNFTRSGDSRRFFYL